MAKRKREPWNPLLCNYPDSVKINSVSIGAETLYTRLLAQCDDGSNYDGDPLLILCGLFRKRYRMGQVTIEDVKGWLGELERSALIACYEVDDEPYIHIIDCKKYLRKDISFDARFPAWPGVCNDDVTPTSPTTYRPRNDDGHDDVTPTSPPAYRQHKRRRNSYPPRHVPSTTTTATTTATTTSGGFALREVVDAAHLLGLDKSKAEEFFHHYQAQGWVLGNGLRIRDLPSALTKWRNNQYKFDQKKSRGKTAAELFEESADAKK